MISIKLTYSVMTTHNRIIAKIWVEEEVDTTQDMGSVQPNIDKHAVNE